MQFVGRSAWTTVKHENIAGTIMCMNKLLPSLHEQRITASGAAKMYTHCMMKL